MSRLSYRLQRINCWDIELCLFFNRLNRNSSARDLFRLVSRLGDGIFWYLLMLLLLLSNPSAALPAVAHMLVVGLTCTALYKSIKGKTLRPRPFNVYPDIVCNSQPLDQFSFPSGHALHAVAFSIIAVAYFPALIWLVLPFTVLVALSRPILGLHYPSDVLAGALIGATLATFSLYLIPN